MASFTTPIIPKALKPGDTIAFISPSARLNDTFPAPLARSVSFFESKGYRIKTIYSPLSSTTLRRGQHVANEIHTAFQDPEVTCIITTCGGTDVNESLRHIDYEIIRNNPKIFVGYSDITLLVYAFFVKAGLRSFYGPCIFTEFAEFPEPDPFTVDHFFQVLLRQEPVAGKQIPYSSSFADPELPFFTAGNSQDTRELRPTASTPAPFFLRPGKAEGPFLGGCLRKLSSLSGSPYLPPNFHAGAIFFFEISQGEYDTAMPLARVRADLFDLLNRGLLNNIVGLVVGRTYHYDDKMHEELYRIVGELIDEEGWKFPVLVGVDIGHTSPMLTVPFGVEARLDSEKGEFCFLNEGVA